MKITTVKFKKGLSLPIRESQKAYDFMCPIDNIEIGDYVLVDVYINGRQHFQVGRVEAVSELVDYVGEGDRVNKIAKKQEPYSYVICKIPVKDFEQRCQQVRKMKRTTRNRNWRRIDKEKKRKKRELTTNQNKNF